MVSGNASTTYSDAAPGIAIITATYNADINNAPGSGSTLGTFTTEVVPEQTSNLILPLFMAMTVLLALGFKKKPSRNR